MLINRLNITYSTNIYKYLSTFAKQLELKRMVTFFNSI